jgi:hypothetical protein
LYFTGFADEFPQWMPEVSQKNESKMSENAIEIPIVAKENNTLEKSNSDSLKSNNSHINATHSTTHTQTNALPDPMDTINEWLQQPNQNPDSGNADIAV